MFVVQQGHLSGSMLLVLTLLLAIAHGFSYASSVPPAHERQAAGSSNHPRAMSLVDREEEGDEEDDEAEEQAQDANMEAEDEEQLEDEGINSDEALVAEAAQNQLDTTLLLQDGSQAQEQTQYTQQNVQQEEKALAGAVATKLAADKLAAGLDQEQQNLQALLQAVKEYESNLQRQKQVFEELAGRTSQYEQMKQTTNQQAAFAAASVNNLHQLQAQKASDAEAMKRITESAMEKVKEDIASSSKAERLASSGLQMQEQRAQQEGAANGQQYVANSMLAMQSVPWNVQERTPQPASRGHYVRRADRVQESAPPPQQQQQPFPGGMLYETDVSRIQAANAQPIWPQAALVAESVDGQGRPTPYDQDDPNTPLTPAQVEARVNTITNADVALGAYIPSDSPFQYVLRGQDVPNLRQDARAQGYSYLKPEEGETRAQQNDIATFQRQFQAQQPQQQPQPWAAPQPLSIMSEDGPNPQIVSPEMQAYSQYANGPMPSQAYPQSAQGQVADMYLSTGASPYPSRQAAPSMDPIPMIPRLPPQGSRYQLESNARRQPEEIPRIWPAEQLPKSQPDMYLSTGASPLQQQPSLEQQGEQRAPRPASDQEEQRQAQEAQEVREPHRSHHIDNHHGHVHGAGLLQAAKVSPHTIERKQEKEQRTRSKHPHEADDRD
mmetsp:Transcript_65819/g.122771  ORF Transcript_65819/g.122771 Transcript_65819/m.122771 type:complete len:666 (-) Transcript_65819:62-2059(-)